ncbi:PA4642 family protein [Acinetobacter sp. B5B]|uniref:PA4642 family protein n=1 Tax=Acinetobacter baretiae TaxID=2605383 RepID=UPI0018C1DF28|nr:PA4642 family protein [Acinetobacter baretiae]MBF7683471.1 PA4642 family protein [Acinetobacter baretiae]MBF7684777.1 PA4642 family protein [Acinetobacter baretiae]
MAVSQPATFNEPWSDERIFAYLNHMPPEGVNADFYVLYNAFKHMRAHDFERLLIQFQKDGRNVLALDPQGENIYDVISKYPKHRTDFLAVLKNFI